MSDSPPMYSADGEPLLSMRRIQKSCDGNPVLKDVDFEVRTGEVHALVGENGAGKSTLMNILAGVHQPSSGTIRLRGAGEITIPDEKTAQRLGIAIVFQERSLFGQLTVAENIFAARQPVNSLGRIDWRRLRQDAGCMLQRTGLNGDPAAPDEGL